MFNILVNRSVLKVNRFQSWSTQSYVVVYILIVTKPMLTKSYHQTLDTYYHSWGNVRITAQLVSDHQWINTCFVVVVLFDKARFVRFWLIRNYEPWDLCSFHIWNVSLHNIVQTWSTSQTFPKIVLIKCIDCVLEYLELLM